MDSPSRLQGEPSCFLECRTAPLVVTLTLLSGSWNLPLPLSPAQLLTLWATFSLLLPGCWPPPGWVFWFLRHFRLRLILCALALLGVLSPCGLCLACLSGSQGSYSGSAQLTFLPAGVLCSGEAGAAGPLRTVSLGKTRHSSWPRWFRAECGVLDSQFLWGCLSRTLPQGVSVSQNLLDHATGEQGD